MTCTSIIPHLVLQREIGFYISNVVFGDCSRHKHGCELMISLFYTRNYFFTESNKTIKTSMFIWLIMLVKNEIEKCTFYKNSEMKIFDKRWTCGEMF